MSIGILSLMGASLGAFTAADGPLDRGSLLHKINICPVATRSLKWRLDIVCAGAAAEAFRNPEAAHIRRGYWASGVLAAVEPLAPQDLLQHYSRRRDLHTRRCASVGGPPTTRPSIAEKRPSGGAASLRSVHTPSTDQTSTYRDHARRGAVAAVAALAAATFVSACGSSGSSSGSTAQSIAPATILNTHHVALAIEQSILSERHIHAQVSCPKVVPQQKGRNFACIATTGKTKTPFAVVQQNSSGYVTYHAE